MTKDEFDRLSKIKYMLEEVQEMVQRAKDVNVDKALMIEDMKAIHACRDLTKLKLYVDYFPF